MRGSEPCVWQRTKLRRSRGRVVRHVTTALLIVAGVLLAARVADVRAAPPSFTAVDLGTLGGSDSRALAINDQGQVVGNSLTAVFTSHAFSWTQAGGIVDLGTLGGPHSNAVAVNESGQVAGSSYLAMARGTRFSGLAA